MSGPVQIDRPEQVPPTAEAILGFIPTDSLVVLGVGGGPTVARVDLSDDDARTLAPHAPQWRQIVVLVYSDDPDHLRAAIRRCLFHLRGPQIVDAIHVAPSRMLSGPNGSGWAEDKAAGEFAANHVAASRDELVAEAAKIGNVEEAMTVAQAAFEVGNGALAWVHLERAVELGAGEDERALILRRNLISGVNPRNVS